MRTSRDIMIQPIIGGGTVPQPPARSGPGPSVRRLRHERASVGDSAAPSSLSGSFADGLLTGFRHKPSQSSADGGGTGTSSTSTTTTATTFGAGLHQRLLEIERKLREFNILDATKSAGGGASSANNNSSSSNYNNNGGNGPVQISSGQLQLIQQPQQHAPLSGSRTSPLPRRPMPLFTSKDAVAPKRREFDWNSQCQPQNQQSQQQQKSGGYQQQPQQNQQQSNNGNGNGNRAVTPRTRHRLSDGLETQRRINDIMQQTGVLKFGGNEYKMQTYDLELIKDLGHGTHGHVVKMKHNETGLLMAVKQIRRSGNKEETKQSIMDLEVVLRSHDCPYIVECLGCFVSDSEVWICMELMDTCMDKLIRRTRKGLPEMIVGKVALSIVKALSYLKEKQGIIHRDVKPSNILMNRDGTIKLCDFGISGRLIDSMAATQTAGCAAYMAPERIQPPDPENANYDIRADVWSLGISLVELTLGRFPYGVCENHFEILTKILLTDSPSLSPSDGFSPMYCDFLDKCLAKDFTKRYKYPDLMNHEFLQYYEKHDVDVAGWFQKSVAPFYEDSP